MTDDMMILHVLIENGPDCDYLREKIDFAAERLTELGWGRRRRRLWREDPARLAQCTGLPRARWLNGCPLVYDYREHSLLLANWQIYAMFLP
jgi:hypothetical protein